MPTRRQFVRYAAVLGAVASYGPLASPLAFAAPTLLQRKIPASGELLPAIGLGTSQTFNVDPQSADMAPLRDVLKAFVDGGARVIDTAPSYGRAEQVTGDLVDQASVRGKVFLATKISATGRDAGMRQIEASFKALQTDKIDLIQVHNLQDTTAQLALLRELKAQGRIRYIGVTHYVESAHDELLDVLKKEKVDFVQVNYSVGARNAERTVLPYCAEHGIATLINRTFEAGRLFAKVKGRALPEWAAKELDASSWAQLMLKFVLANPAVTTVIPATSQPRYVLDNLLAGQGRLPDAAQLQRIAAEFA